MSATALPTNQLLSIVRTYLIHTIDEQVRDMRMSVSKRHSRQNDAREPHIVLIAVLVGILRIEVVVVVLVSAKSVRSVECRCSADTRWNGI